MEKVKPLVYIILVNYNGFVDTDECIKSLKKITYNNYKIVVVDNDSMDGSGKRIEESYKNEIIYIASKDNLGFAGGNNLGIKFALDNKADYVLLLNNDTIVEDDFLEPLVELSESDKSIGVVGGKIYYYYEQNKLWFAGAKINKFTGKTNHIGLNEIDQGQYDEIKGSDYITGCMMLVKKQAILNTGLMNEEYFLYYEETDWNVRMHNSGFKIMYTPKSKIYHKVSSSMSSISKMVNYYYDRNVVYFITHNYSCINGFFVKTYIYGRLGLRIAKAFINKDQDKIIITKQTIKSIKQKTMGKYKTVLMENEI